MIYKIKNSDLLCKIQVILFKNQLDNSKNSGNSCYCFLLFPIVSYCFVLFRTKIWEIKNTGPSQWLSRKLECMDVAVEMPQLRPHVALPALRSGLIPAQRVIDIPETRPGEAVTLQMEFTAPCYPCSVMSYWCMTDQRNEICYPESEGLSCVVQVLDINAL